MQNVRLLALALLACNGEDPKDDGAVPETDADTDADTDSDTDADTDADSDVDATDSAPTVPLGSGPIAPAFYAVYPVYVYQLAVPVPPGDSGDTAGDTGTPIGPTPAAFLRFDALFGFDGNGNVMDGVLNGDPFPSVVNAYFGTSEWQATTWDLADTDQYCTITFSLTNGTLAPWVAQTPRLYWGTEYPGGPLASDCNAPGSPVDLKAFGDPVNDWQGQAGIGAAVGGLLPDVEDLIGPAFGADIVYVLGSQFRLDVVFGPNAPIDDMYAIAYEMDPATGELTVDADGNLARILAADVYPYP